MHGDRGLLQPGPFERLHRDLTHYMRQSAPNFVLADVWRFVLESNDLYWGSYFFDLLGVVS